MNSARFVNHFCHAMSHNSPQAKILAQGIYEMRLLLSAYLGSQNEADLRLNFEVQRRLVANAVGR